MIDFLKAAGLTVLLLALLLTLPFLAMMWFPILIFVIIWFVLKVVREDKNNE